MLNSFKAASADKTFREPLRGEDLPPEVPRFRADGGRQIDTRKVTKNLMSVLWVSAEKLVFPVSKSSELRTRLDPSPQNHSDRQKTFNRLSIPHTEPDGNRVLKDDNQTLDTVTVITT